MSRPTFVVEVRNGWTLVTGTNARRTLVLLGYRPHYVAHARGYAVDDPMAAHDVQAYASYHHGWVKIIRSGGRRDLAKAV